MNRKQFSLLGLMLISSVASGRSPERGYRGFVDWSNNVRSELVWSGLPRSTVFYTGGSTCHGFQFDSHFFVGGGFVFEYSRRLDNHLFSPFVSGRYDVSFGSFTPFGDVRLGYNLTDGGGVYFSPSVGYRFNWGRKMGVNVAVGLNLTGYSVVCYDMSEDVIGYTHLYKTGTYHRAHAYFSFRVGIDF